MIDIAKLNLLNEISPLLDNIRSRLEMIALCNKTNTDDYIISQMYDDINKLRWNAQKLIENMNIVTINDGDE